MNIREKLEHGDHKKTRKPLKMELIRTIDRNFNNMFSLDINSKIEIFTSA